MRTENNQSNTVVSCSQSHLPRSCQFLHFCLHTRLLCSCWYIQEVLRPVRPGPRQDVLRAISEWRARATCKETLQATCSADNHACAVQLPTPRTVFCICSVLKSSNMWTRRTRLKSLCYADQHHSSPVILGSNRCVVGDVDNNHTL